MITEVINDYVDALQAMHQDEPNGFISELAGLVRVHEQLVTVDEKQTIEKMPMAISDYSLYPVSNEPFEIHRLVPDQRKRCIIFFEASPFQSQSSTAFQTTYLGRIDLLCWFNKTGFSAPANRLQTLLTNRLVYAIKNVKPYDSAEVDYEVFGASQLIENDPSIFAKYNFNDRMSAYFSDPFGCFKYSFNLKITAYEACTSVLNPITLSECS